jgi:excisionase family DNA binding protein
MTTWLTVREAAAYVRVSQNLIREAIKLGYLLPAYAIGTGVHYRLRTDDIDEWMMSRSWEPKGSRDRR